MRSKLFVFLSAIIFSTAVMAADPQVELKTNMGTIVLELNSAKAPKTTENFLQYVKDGHYKGVIFHRVIPNFMIQTGGFSAGFVERKTRAPILNEASNGLRNETGTIAMARTNDPNSATAQFFINVKDNDFLNFAPGNPGFAVFGKVVKGLDVVSKIATVETGNGPPPHGDVPRKPIVIEDAKILPEAK
jgi:cyclophilin family peptidyl-prolyl cis-trans isomerase